MDFVKKFAVMIIFSTASVTCSGEDLADKISKKFKISPERAAQIIRIAETEAAKVDLDSSLVLAVIGVESGFRHTVKSSYGCVGLMQINWRVHQSENKTDEVSNIRTGVNYLSYLVKKHGLDYGVTAYNLGESGMLRRKKITRYTKKVMKMKKELTE